MNKWLRLLLKTLCVFLSNLNMSHARVKRLRFGIFLIYGNLTFIPSGIFKTRRGLWFGKKAIQRVHLRGLLIDWLSSNYCINLMSFHGGILTLQWLPEGSDLVKCRSWGPWLIEATPINNLMSITGGIFNPYPHGIFYNLLRMASKSI